MCEHRWRQIFEVVHVINYPVPLGWECLECSMYIENSKLTPIGLGGVITKAQRLKGEGACSDGSRFKEQIYHEDGRLEIIR